MHCLHWPSKIRQNANAGPATPTQMKLMPFKYILAVTGRSILPVFSHLILTATSEVGIIIPILQTRKLRFSEVKQIVKDTQLVGDTDLKVSLTPETTVLIARGCGYGQSIHSSADHPMPRGSWLQLVTMTTSIYSGHSISKILNKSQFLSVLLPESLRPCSTGGSL